MLSQASAIGTVWVQDQPPPTRLSSWQKQSSPPPCSAKGPGRGTPHAQLSLAAPYTSNTFPFQVTGEAKT